MKVHNPPAVPAASAYSQGIEVPPHARWLHISGQVGVGRDGKLAEGVEAQSHQAWKNLKAVLAEAGMGIEDIVKVTAFLTDENAVAAYRRTRLEHMAEARPAATLLIVKRLADPAWLVEIEAVAAKP